MTESSSEKELAERATFIFKGTVQKLKAATMRSVQVTDHTLVVRVDQVMQGPKTLAAYLDQDITVQLSAAGKLKKGEQAIFYTNPWLFGESVAVQSIGQTKVQDKPRSMARAADPVQTGEDQKFSHHLTQADVVVQGRVLSIRMPRDDSAPKGMASTAATRPVSEHSGHWREAVVEVSDVLHGEHAHQQIIVRFPSSRDIRWARSPKFEPGDEGIFILHKDEPQQRPTKSAQARPATTKKKRKTQAYTALHPEDFQPLHKAVKMRATIQASSQKKSSATKKRR
ncbi:MAG TPA: hypothetical protein VGO91_19520 [Pyrinomonadaceae bacterium]|jgi:hypothetical protein|nr:hypothetical protein [Pyrinomonadaceae bacterium]